MLFVGIHVVVASDPPVPHCSRVWNSGALADLISVWGERMDGGVVAMMDRGFDA